MSPSVTLRAENSQKKHERNFGEVKKKKKNIQVLIFKTTSYLVKGRTYTSAGGTQF